VSRVGLLVALRAEVPAFLAPQAGSRISIHQLGQTEVGLLVSGVGQRRAGAAAERLCQAFAPDVLLVLGVCGGAAPRMAVGDLLVAEEIIAGRNRISLDRDLSAAAVQAAQEWRLPVCRGALQTCAWPALSRRGLAPGILAVDMESYAIALLAQGRGLPALVVRAVSDIVPERATPRALARWLRQGWAGFPTAQRRLERFAGLYLPSPRV
jgi:adenosylhomocysteine nucleosidase